MGTRSNVRFIWQDEMYQVYKHWDGYLENMIPHLAKFIKWNGIRSDDIGYTVANYITFVKLETCGYNEKQTIEEEFEEANSNSGTLHTGIGLVNVSDDFEDSWIEYFYEVDLSKRTVKAFNPSEKKELLGEFGFDTPEALAKMAEYVDPEVKE